MINQKRQMEKTKRCPRWWWSLTLGTQWLAAEQLQSHGHSSKAVSSSAWWLQHSLALRPLRRITWCYEWPAQTQIFLTLCIGSFLNTAGQSQWPASSWTLLLESFCSCRCFHRVFTRSCSLPLARTQKLRWKLTGHNLVFRILVWSYLEL